MSTQKYWTKEEIGAKIQFRRFSYDCGQKKFQKVILQNGVISFEQLYKSLRIGYQFIRQIF